MCPKDYPWVFDDGNRCCKSSERIDGGPMYKNAPKSTCKDGEWVQCPDGGNQPTTCTNYKGPCDWQSNLVYGRSYPERVMANEER